jgi:hypothetical protein
MLSVVRSGTINAFEFDNDVTIAKSDLPKFLALKETFKSKYGLSLYGQEDFILVKGLYRLYAFEWQPYLMSACGRIYDEDHWLFTDFFCDYEIPASELEHELTTNVANRPISEDASYYCQGWNADLCACRATKDMYPRQPVMVKDTRLYVPHHAELVCEQCYGADWRTPKPKGIKVFACVPLVQVVLALVLAYWGGVLGLGIFRQR